MRKGFLARVPKGRLGEPSDLAGPLLFLASSRLRLLYRPYPLCRRRLYGRMTWQKRIAIIGARPDGPRHSRRSSPRAAMTSPSPTRWPNPRHGEGAHRRHLDEPWMTNCGSRSNASPSYAESAPRPWREADIRHRGGTREAAAEAGHLRAARDGGKARSIALLQYLRHPDRQDRGSTSPRGTACWAPIGGTRPISCRWSR